MRRILLSTSAILLASASQTAFAQQAEDGANDNSDTIVVTARKREENLVDVPLPITVATAAQLQRDQIYNLTDLQRITPALEISQTSGGETNGGGRLRGVGTGVFNPSVQSSVALVVDQAPIGNLAFPQLFDLAQVEVLRGPQGTLFGQGASAGVLNISTKAPTLAGFKVSGSVDFANKGTAGSEVGELVFNGGVNVPLGDNAAIRLATQYKKETGLQRSATTGKDNRIEDFGFRARALIQASETLKINLSGEYGQEKSNGQTFFAIAIAPNSTAPFGPPGGTLGGISNGAFLNPTGCAMTVISARAEQYCEAAPTDMKLKATSFGAVIDLEASDTVSITSVTAYRKRKFQQFSRDFSRITGTFAARQEMTEENSRGFSQELRANIKSDALDVVVGGFYSEFRFDRVPIGNGPFVFNNTTSGQRIGFSICNFVTNACVPQAFNPGPLFVNFSKETTKNRGLAAFVDATVKLGDQFGIFGGLRYDNYKNDTAVGSNTLTPGAPFTTKDNNLSGRIGANFKPNPDTNIYASYSRGYKPPAVGTNPAGALFTLRPEKSDTFELGAKFSLGGFQMAANAFYTNLANFQSQTSVFVGTALVSQPLNIPKLKSKGFELTAFGKVAQNFTINAGYQFNDITFPAGYVGDDGGNLGGTQFLNAPKHKFSLSGEYSAPLSDSLELFTNANMIYKSRVLLAARADPRYRYPSHAIINLGIGVRNPDNKWTASVFVRNLTKQREPTAYLASTFAGQADGGIRAWPIAGLTARVIGVRFGFDY
jgi:iron complex outermembrane recepter protein